MIAIRENGTTLLASFDYDDLGRRERLTLGNGAVTHYRFDPVSRLRELEHDFGGTGHDNLVTFTYNAASQIETRLATNDLYAWTGHGNGTTTYVVDGLNRLTSQTTAGLGTTSFVHDARGNRLNDGARTYGYDSENKSRGVATAPYHYDPLGRLSGAVNSPGTPPAIAYESYIDRLVAERTPGTLTPQRRHVFGPGVDEPLVWYEGTDRRFLSADERGSIVAVSDGSGVVRNVNRYDEYGQTQRTDPYYMSRFGFTGQRYFSGHGLYHYKNRMYDPKTGRFMQPDPIGYGSGLNLYAYVGGDPVNSSDPSGLTPQHIICTGTRLGCGAQHDSGGSGLSPGSSGASEWVGRPNMAAIGRSLVPYTATVNLVTGAASVTFGGRFQGTTLAGTSAQQFLAGQYPGLFNAAGQNWSGPTFGQQPSKGQANSNYPSGRINTARAGGVPGSQADFETLIKLNGLPPVPGVPRDRTTHIKLLLGIEINLGNGWKMDKNNFSQTMTVYHSTGLAWRVNYLPYSANVDIPTGFLIAPGVRRTHPLPESVHYGR
jgi:RHS repeat-associated protein